MTKFTATLALAGILAAPVALAQQEMYIDDDGIYYRDVGATPDYVLDINDDGFVRLPRAEADGDALAFAGGPCTQLELNAGLAPGDCGAMNRDDLARKFIDMND